MTSLMGDAEIRNVLEKKTSWCEVCVYSRRQLLFSVTASITRAFGMSDNQ